MLISVHIPKTGGTSFKEFLTLHYQNKLFLDYGDQPMAKDSETRNKQAMAHQLTAPNLSVDYDCIHGHFLPTKYDIAAQHNLFAVWFRDPVERVVSRFFHGKRHLGADQIVTESMSLEEFCEIEHFHNLYAKYLWNFPVRKFDFIGITEDYNNSLELFCKLLNMEYIGAFHENKNPSKTKCAYEISPDVRKLIADTNHQDYEIYWEAIDINKKLKKRFLINP